MSNRTSAGPALTVTEARALKPVAEGFLNHIRDVLIHCPPTVDIEPPEAADAAGSAAETADGSRVESNVHPDDRTDSCIRAYLASIKPIDGVVFQDEIQAANHRGRGLIERLALSVEGTDWVPNLHLSANQIADVLSFVHCSEPMDRQTWWIDPEGKPSWVCGFILVLEALERSLRALGTNAATPLSRPQHQRLTEEEIRARTAAER